MSEHVISLIIGILAAVLGHFILKFWPALHWTIRTRLWVCKDVTPSEGFKALSGETKYWMTKLGKDTFVLRFLPFEITARYFEAMGLDNYDKTMKEYKESIVNIIRLGEAGGVDYWDWSIFGLCGDEEIDAATAYAINAMYFPVYPDAFRRFDRQLAAAEEEKKAANTSALALFREYPAVQGIFLIGKYKRKHDANYEGISEYLKDVKWKTGFSMHFRPDRECTADKWIPRKFNQTHSQIEIKTLASKFEKIWASLPRALTEPPSLEQKHNEVVNINVDRVVAPRDATKWRGFITRWFSPTKKEEKQSSY